MTQVCPKCSHSRTPVETVPEWQCPGCGIAYAKFQQSTHSATALLGSDGGSEGTTSYSRTLLFAVFAAKGVRYVELDIERDHEGAQFQNDVLRVSGVPVIVIGNRLVVGFDETQISAGLKEL